MAHDIIFLWAKQAHTYVVARSIYNNNNIIAIDQSSTNEHDPLPWYCHESEMGIAIGVRVCQGVLRGS